ncbi:hypothetical protein GHJ91_33885, partial [Sinorhizobium medicae]|nr:hypothetical protein [Sinorhizobium medicae]
MIRKSVCPLWPADIPPALCRKARPSAATYTTSRDTISRIARFSGFAGTRCGPMPIHQDVV